MSCSDSSGEFGFSSLIQSSSWPLFSYTAFVFWASSLPFWHRELEVTGFCDKTS
ncbi:hypothetical protein BD289DRAFT_429073 [Coniella lustricola]|uniref:Uncharacterized protein n=1 Tax=Coniella lustricola TaxID=2025994 RepID=A0A2T3AD85_9PEZI|nr:hypothetical protein BD289DRAFT_429073 [Coniella lustricola]